MKVYIVTKEPFPNGMAAVNRIKCYAKAITEQGVECEVLIFTRTEKYGKAPRNMSGKGVSDEGIPFCYIGGTPLRGENVFIRQINDRLDKWNTLRYLKRHLSEGDIVFMYYEDVCFSLKLINVAHSRGAVVVRDLCELPYGTGAETRTAVLRRKKTLEKQFPLLDGIIPISDALLHLAQKYANKHCKFLKVPIMVDFEKYALEERSSEADVPYIFHSGTLYEQKDGILGMITAFGQAVARTNTPVKFVSTGTIENSPHAEEIRRLIVSYHLEDKLVFTGYLSEEELKDYLSKASMVIINKYKTQQNRYCFSTKLGEYLAAEKPVIITNVGEAMNWLDNQTAYIVESHDVNGLADKIVYVLQHTNESLERAKRGKELCKKNFDYRSWGKSMCAFLSDITENYNHYATEKS